MNTAAIFTDAMGTVRIHPSIVGQRISYTYEGERRTGTVTEWIDMRRARPAYPESVIVTIDGEFCDDGTTPNSTSVTMFDGIEIL